MVVVLLVILLLLSSSNSRLRATLSSLNERVGQQSANCFGTWPMIAKKTQQGLNKRTSCAVNNGVGEFRKWCDALDSSIEDESPPDRFIVRWIRSSRPDQQIWPPDEILSEILEPAQQIWCCLTHQTEKVAVVLSVLDFVSDVVWWRPGNLTKFEKWHA